MLIKSMLFPAVHSTRQPAGEMLLKITHRWWRCSFSIDFYFLDVIFSWKVILRNNVWFKRDLMIFFGAVDRHSKFQCLNFHWKNYEPATDWWLYCIWFHHFYSVKFFYIHYFYLSLLLIHIEPKIWVW